MRDGRELTAHNGDATLVIGLLQTFAHTLLVAGSVVGLEAEIRIVVTRSLSKILTRRCIHCSRDPRGESGLYSNSGSRQLLVRR